MNHPVVDKEFHMQADVIVHTFKLLPAKTTLDVTAGFTSRFPILIQHSGNDSGRKIDGSTTWNLEYAKEFSMEI